MKARYVIAGSVVLVLSIVIFIGIQDAKAYAAEGIAAAQQEPDYAGISQVSPSKAAVYGMSQEIAIWSEVAELVTFAGGGIALLILGYGLLSKDWQERPIHTRR